MSHNLQHGILDYTSLGSSDHQVISFKYSCYADWSKSQHKFNYGKGDFVGARLYLDEHPIRVDGDVDSMWESFKKSVIEVRDRHIPLMRKERGNGNLSIQQTWG